MNFYDVRGVLVRWWEPVRQGIALEVWDGEGWSAYTDVDAVLRYGLQRDKRVRGLEGAWPLTGG